MLSARQTKQTKATIGQADRILDTPGSLAFCVCDILPYARVLDVLRFG